MSDTRLRDLERRWKETGAVGDEAAYLLERVRVGELTRERLELAAYCGHPGARCAYGHAQVAPTTLLEWLIKIPGPRQPVLVLASILASEAAWLEWLKWDLGRRVERPLLSPHANKSARVWLLCPCDPHAQRVGPIVSPAGEDHALGFVRVSIEATSEEVVADRIRRGVSSWAVDDTPPHPDAEMAKYF